ncbi:Non-hemolytic phospholipase C [Purpureocillium lavendulum]|uniref:Non-hemolytic phospholipase C n=1 Tax=Purpureocillium lavendulum TaxID=1247861 RepID=A0AB34FS93_9HYPO|nr:Non-hemolytic phospholipase C [Purpureocillium lavendulum]
MNIIAFFSVLAGVQASWPMAGWRAYRDYDLHVLRPDEETHEFSSYDRANHNDDGFDGTYSCLRLQGSRCVIAEYDGPGEIASIWFTYEPDSVEPIGDMAITLDGTEVLRGGVQDVVDGKLGAPFAWPFVGNTNDTMGGNVIKVPMAFRESMLVTTENNPHFYHVVYRRFPAGTEAETFNPKDKAQDVVAQFQSFGVRDPKAVKGGALNKPGKHVKGSVAGSSGTVKLGKGCGIVTQLALRLPSVPATTYVQDDGRAFGPGGGSSFSLGLDPNNKRCRLTRRIDRTIGNQKVKVTVNGAAVTADSGAAANGTWFDQVVDIPAAATKGKSKVDVSVACLSSDFDCNEFLYALHCEADGAWATSGYVPSKDWTLMDVLNVGWNNENDEKSHGYNIQGQTWDGLRQFTYNDDEHTDAATPDIRLSLTFDGKKTVSQVPMGAFFAASLAKGLTRSLLLSVDSLVPNGAWTSYFPMPFSESASLTLMSGDGSPLNATVDAVVQPCSGSAPAPGASAWGRFSVQHRRGPTTPGQLWPLLYTGGRGVAYGVTHTFRGSILQPANTLEFLEGDEQAWLNRTTPGGFNDTTATLRGTGTEDFYESGWYFQDANAPGQPVTVPYAMPLTGLTTSAYAVAPGMGGCVGSCLAAHRLMVADSQAFGDGIAFGIEHGPDGNNVQAEYETCAFYYA